MLSRVETKEKSKNSLKNVWGESIKIILISLGINLLTQIILAIITIVIKQESSIINIIEIIIEGMLTFGFLSFFVKVSRNEEVTCNELFSKASMCVKFICASIFIGIVTLIGCILLIIPGIIATLGLSQTMYILLDNPDMSVIDAMKKSWDLMKGHKADYLVLQISFVGWAILCTIPLCLGYLWLIPYMQVTKANFYNELLRLDNEKMSE